MSEVVTRFAPSPTGYLHIGGARTALFNWLHARRTGGTFVLRIEDTDQERSTPESVQAIFDGMNWLGMNWDQGPFFQTQRMDTYKQEAQRLIDEGKAYRCTCTAEDLDQRREDARARGEKPRYDGRCRNLSPAETEGRNSVVRFRLPGGGQTVVHDFILGDVTFENSELDDMILIRTDGFPTYNFVVVVDDASMGISLVLRGNDHLNNTPKQILLYDALGYTVPVFGHVPMILGKDGTKLSKRHGAMSVMAYQEMGYLPEAMVNYLVRLGWSHGDQEIFSVEELKQVFSLDHIGKSAGKFDPDKLTHLNAHYIKNGDPVRIALLLVPFLANLGIETEPSDRLAAIVRTLQERSKTLIEMAEASLFYFQEKAIDPVAAKKVLTPEALDLLDDVTAALSGACMFTHDSIEAALAPVVAKADGKLGRIAQPIRVGLTGGTVSPGVFEIMEVLGKEEVIRRLSSVRNRIPA